MTISTGTLTGTGAGDAIKLSTERTVSLQGVNPNTVAIEISVDEGATWEEIASFTDNTVQDVELSRRRNYQIRVNCTAYTSNTITWKIW